MQKLRAKLLFFLIPALFLIPFLGKYVLAQAPPLDISATTVLFEFNPKPAAEIKDTVRIRNNSTNNTNLKVGIKKLTQGNKGEAVLEDLENNDPFKQAISFEKEKFTLSANGSSEIPFIIKIPSDAAFGYYYAITITQDETADVGTVRFIGELAIPLIINVQRPGAKVEATIQSFEPKQKINEYLPVEFETTIKNSGNVSTKVRGNIFIKGLGGKDLSFLEVNPGKANTLPGAGNTFTSEWNDGFLVRESVTEDNQVLKDDDKNVKTKLKINWNKITSFRFGKYSANLLLVYDDGSRDVTIEGNTTFWIIPYKIIIAIMLALAVIIFTIKKTLSWYVKKQIQKQSKTS